MPRVSVLMPVYNGMPYIPEAIDSVLSQSLSDWELVIADNGSIDGTAEYVESITDPRIRYFRHQKNLGIFGNLNFLIKEAQAPIAKILCADDKLLPGGLIKIVEFMEGNPDCVLSRCLGQGDSVHFGAGGFSEIEGKLPTRLAPSAAVLAFATFGNLVGNLSKAAFKPRHVLELGGFDQSYPYAGDFEGWLRVSSKYGICLQNVELIYERRHEGQSTVTLNKKNELLPQINSIIEKINESVTEDVRGVLKKHWTVHFMAPRLSRSIRQILSGNFLLAYSALERLPVGISPLGVVFSYPVWRLFPRFSQKTTLNLFEIIKKENER